MILVHNIMQILRKKGWNMFKKVVKLTLFTLSVIIGSCFIFLSQAKATNIVEAKLYGDFNLESSETTNVIVELSEKSIVESKHSGVKQSEDILEFKRDIIIENVHETIDYANVIQEYHYVFSGFSLDLPGNEIPNLLTIPGIKAVYPSIEYSINELPEISEYYPNMTYSNPYIGTHEVWNMGYTGEGMTVAVIDSGVDYNHPELIHAFDEYKGYDFVDNDDDPMEAFDPSLPNPDCYLTFHGTHVTGTIVAASFGIAPDARILAYRVLGVNGGTSSQVIAGIEQAVIDGADVMNLSLGNDMNDPDYATSIALDWAMTE